LRDLVARLDRVMFEAYNAHDVDGLMSWFTADLEFYHDTGGLVDFEQVKTGFANLFVNNKDIRRDLVEGSLAVQGQCLEGVPGPELRTLAAGG
jgi:hypothetical protein